MNFARAIEEWCVCVCVCVCSEFEFEFEFEFDSPGRFRFGKRCSAHVIPRKMKHEH